MFYGILKNKIFRVCLVLLVITFPFTLKYKLVMTMGSSMEPTLSDGEWLILEKKSSLDKNWFPRRLDTVVAKDGKENIIKRIIGLPGETVEIKNGNIYINKKILNDPFGIRYVPEQTIMIPKGYVWIIGDNREDSWYGLMPIKNIIGKIL